jgi:hypothetical protein
MKGPSVRRTSIKGSFRAALALLPILTWAETQEMKTIRLNGPNKKRGLPRGLQQPISRPELTSNRCAGKLLPF